MLTSFVRVLCLIFFLGRENIISKYFGFTKQVEQSVLSVYLINLRETSLLKLHDGKILTL